MKKHWILHTFLATLLLITSCKQPSISNNSNQEVTDNIISQSITNEEGSTLDMVFDNNQDIVTITFEGETSELETQRPASGIWYQNDEYELRGKGNDITLWKNDEIVFKHWDETTELEARNEQDDVLNIVVNHTTGTAKVYLNGGQQIDLQEERAASGIWYQNEEYELRGKGDKYILYHNDKVVFEN